MKIQIASDLHTDFNELLKNEIPIVTPCTDILVMAGDLCERVNLKRELEKLCKLFKHVIYVPGNHDYYRSSFAETKRTILEAEKEFKSLHVLENKRIKVEGKWFIGNTLWFENDPLNEKYKWDLNDFSFIEDFEPIVYNENVKAKNFLKEFFQKGDIIVTHHFPHHKSIAPEYKGSELNRFFFCDMEDFILQKGPSLWIHGHTHEGFDYRVAMTRIVCNPYGYRQMGEGKEYKPDMVVEV